MVGNARARASAPELGCLREWRLSAGWTQEQLAGYAGVSSGTVSLLERDPHAETQPRIARKLEAVFRLGPGGLRTPPPGAPTPEERGVLDLLAAVGELARDAGAGPALNGIRRGGEEGAAALARWAADRPAVALPAPDRLRAAAGFLARLADAAEAPDDGG